MSQFLPSITKLKQDLAKRAESIRVLQNVHPSTLDRDAHRAIFNLAQLVATQFPSAELMFSWTKESISYSLPSQWSNASSHWLAECPRLQAAYPEVLAADDAMVSATSDGAFLFVNREVVVDTLVARVTVEATIPREEVTLLRAIGKIQNEFHEAYTTTHLMC